MKHVVDYADCTAPTRQHELAHTDQEHICLERSVDLEVGVGDLDVPTHHLQPFVETNCRVLTRAVRWLTACRGLVTSRLGVTASSLP